MTEINNIQPEADSIESLNYKVLVMLSKYLNNAPDFIQKEIVDEIVAQCHVTSEYAFAVLLAAVFGLNTDENRQDAEMFNQYFIPMVNQLDRSEYYRNPYYKDIKIPDIKIGKSELKNISYKPYEAFVFSDLVRLEDGKVIPQIGFFKDEFTYPALLEDERIWMTITPNEIETMKEPVEKANGNVLTYGLGLGYYTYMVSEKSDVSTVTVVEQNEDVINIFKTNILPQFKHKDKIRIIKDDAFRYAKEQMPIMNFDFVFTDLWHDVSDGTDMYLKMKEYEKFCPHARFSYWIEKSILCYL